MKIEIEIDDSLYEAMMKVVPDDVDISIALSKLIEGSILAYATHQEEIHHSLMGEATEEEREVLDDLTKSRVEKAFDAAKKKEPGSEGK